MTNESNQNLNKVTIHQMKESNEIYSQRLLKLISQPGLIKKMIWIFILFIATITLFGIVAGSIITTSFFPNSHF